MKFILILGKTCTGKDTLLTKIKNKFNLNEMKSATTRPKRYEDENTYYFTDDDSFIKKYISHYFIEAYCYNHWYYGMLKSEINEQLPNITSLSIERINLFYDYLKENNLLDSTLVIFLHCPEKTRLKRYINRLLQNKQFNLTNCTEMVRRFHAENKQYEVELKNFPHIIHFDTSKEKHSILLKTIKQFLKEE